MRIWFLGLGCVLLLASGCRTQSITEPIFGPVYSPKNVFAQGKQMPVGLQRVAVLPLSCDADDPLKISGRDVLEPILQIGLGKAQRFECVPVSVAQLKQWTGREKWSSSDQLPADFMQTLQRELGCDAVLFSQLTHYRPYPPLVNGWNFKLVDVKTKNIIWALDEVLDAGEVPVANGARIYQRDREKENPALADSRQILTSPKLFGQYTVQVVLATMPQR